MTKNIKKKSLAVIGLGYIGLPTACTFAVHGVKVVGVDINPKIINLLSNGKLHLFEPGLQEIYIEAQKTKNIEFKNELEEVDSYLIAVPTPFKDNKKADLSYVIAAAEAIAPILKKGNLVVLESTSPPRTTIDIVAPILEKSKLKAGKDFFLAYSPERVLPGRILHELIFNNRVIGGVDQASAIEGKNLYLSFVKGEIYLTDSTTAELVKLMENTYRDINIAAANEFSKLASKFKINVWEAIELANKHPRVNILNPGPGVGGHCISVDPWFLIEAAPELTKLISEARRTNDLQPNFVIDQLIEKFGNLKGKTISVLGLAYKPNVDDIRESPAIKIVQLLLEKGANVEIFEPYKKDLTIGTIKNSINLKACILNADLILLLVGHEQFKLITPEEIRGNSKVSTIFDCVNLLGNSGWKENGFHLFHLGDGSNNSL